jgi:hypothetical protein
VLTLRPSIGAPVYAAGLVTFTSGLEGLFPGFTGSSNAGWDASAATPTVFSGYAGSYLNQIPFTTAAGLLVLDYDPNIGISASINGVPEPSSGLLVVGTAGLAGLGTWARRRRRAKVAG